MLKATKFFVISIISSTMIIVSFADQGQTGRIWLGDDVSFATDFEDIGEKEKWYGFEHDDSNWDKIVTGGSYQEQGYSDYKGISWYRKGFTVPNDWIGKIIYLEITHIKEPSKLYINGELVDSIQGWMLSFDVTKFLKVGTKNLIAIKMHGNSDNDGLIRRRFQLLLMDPVVKIGLSSSIPVVGEEVQIAVYESGAAGKEITINDPCDNVERKTLDATAKACWKPFRYGKYTISYGKMKKTVWVTVDKLLFHYWDESSLPNYATDVLAFDTKKQLRSDYWEKKGVNYVAYGYGLELEGKNAFETNQTWAELYGNRIFDGLTIDEHFCNNSFQQMSMTEALVLARQQKGEDFSITPYVAHSEAKAFKCFWDFRKADAKIMWENYEGDDWTFQKRWLDLKYWRMDELGGVLAQAPGLSFGLDVRGAKTVEEFEEEIRKIRTIAPEMKGLSFFNGYFTDEIDIASDSLIENYFFKPVIHIHPKDGKLVFQNIGNEDTPDDITIVFYSDNLMVLSKKLPVLKPKQIVLFTVPEAATMVKLAVNADMINLYPDGYQIPKVLNPLQVVSASLTNLDRIVLSEKEPLNISFTFNKEIASVTAKDISLCDTATVSYTPIDITFDKLTKTLNIVYRNLPTGDYSLALISSESGFRDLDGNILDGSGDGQLATSRREDNQLDDYTLYFSVEIVKTYADDFDCKQVGGVCLGNDISFNIDPQDKGIEEKWYSPDYDSSKWSKLDSGKCYEAQGFEGYDGIAWYKKTFPVPVAWAGKKVCLEITVMSAPADYYLNGIRAGTLNGWSIEQDVSDYLNPGQLNTIAIRTTDCEEKGGLYRECFQLKMMDPIVKIGLSNSMPVVGESVEISVYDDEAVNKNILIIHPDGKSEKLVLDYQAKVIWRVKRYGKYSLIYDGMSKTVWVTVKPLVFHYWDDTALPEYATHVMGFDGSETQRAEYWHRNGVKYIAYGTGYGHENKNPKEISMTWIQNCQNPIYSGISIDELCPDLRPAQLAMTEALVLTREKKGYNTLIAPYIAGIAYENIRGIWNFHKSNSLVLWENYWGPSWLYQKRWLDVKYTGLDEKGGILCIAPNFTGDNIQGSLNVEQLKREFALLRRIAPEMQGLAFFNAYFARELDHACDGFIEDFFLKPIIHIHPKNGKLVFQNIGNEDLPTDIKAVFNSAEPLQILLPQLKPYDFYEAEVPEGASKVELRTPDFITNLYPEGYDVPDVLNPLQVVNISIDEFKPIKLDEGQDFEVVLSFNNELKSVTPSDIKLYDCEMKEHGVDDLQFDSATNSLTLLYKAIPTNDYVLILKNSISDSSGNPLDGSGDGIFKTNDSQIDDYTFYFSIIR
jgi:hypothetical protein